MLTIRAPNCNTIISSRSPILLSGAPGILSDMNRQPEQACITISPDARAYVALLLAFSPLVVIWALSWWTKGTPNWPLIEMTAGLFVAALYTVKNKTVRIDLAEISQGWPPFRTRMSYPDVCRIHHVYVSSRYGSTVCLGISALAGKKKITLPLKSFSLAKRKQLVEILKLRAPQARIDASCLHG